MSITTLSYRKIDLELKNTPENIGPGSYNPKNEHYIEQSQISKIIPFGSTTRRELFPDLGDPQIGPGMYDLSIRGHKLKHDFGVAKREIFINKDCTPSPADYLALEKWGEPKTS